MNDSFIHSFIQSFNDSLIHSFIHIFIHSSKTFIQKILIKRGALIGLHLALFTMKLVFRAVFIIAFVDH